MAGKQAKVLSNSQIERLLLYAKSTRAPERNQAIVYLSTKAGLRAGEIAKLTWQMVLDASGQIASVIELQDRAAKMGSGRSIPIHPCLYDALTELRVLYPIAGPVIRSQRGSAMTPLSIVVWFHRAYQYLGFEGCSSHSGRRTFITKAARTVHKAGGSLRDVQLLAGHRSIQTHSATSKATARPNAASCH